MNKIIKRLLFLTIILLVIIIILLIYFNGKKINQTDKPDLPTDNPLDFEVNKSIKECDVTNNYFIVKRIIVNYYLYCSNLNLKSSDINTFGKPIDEGELEKSAETERITAKEKIYNCLYKDYITEFNISKDDIGDSFVIDKNLKTIIRKIYSFQNSNNVTTYIVYGVNINENEQKESKFIIGVCLDQLNNSYSIIPQEYCKKHNYNDLKIGSILDIPINNIEKNKDNNFSYRLIRDNEVCQELFYNYKYSVLYDLEYAYEMLNEEYKEKRFKTIENYKKLVQENRDLLEKCNITQYKVTGNEGKKRYICKDNYDNYYIFNQKNIINYSLYLDTYTIETEEFLNKYNESSEKDKAGMNIERIFEAINMKDYNYIYSHLNETFRDNNFGSVSSLEKYLKNNLYDINSISGEDFSNEGTVQIFKINVTNKAQQDQNKNMSINIQLKEETDFEISFNIE